MNNIPIFPPNDSVVTRMDPSDIAERLQIMRRQEETTYKCTDYFSQYRTFTNTIASSESQNNSQQQNKKVDTTARLKMCEWCCEIASFCNYRRETVAVGISLLDTYLSNYFHESVFIALSDPKQFQLAALTTLYMAIKLHEPVVLDVETLSEFSRGCYSIEDIEQMEREILKTIKWHVNGPSEHEFIQHFLSLLPSNVSPEATKMILDLSQQQLNLAILDYQFVTVNPSIVAIASVLNTMERIEINDTLFAFEDRIKFLQLLSNAYGDIDLVDLEKTRIDLLELIEPKSKICEHKGGSLASRVISTIFLSKKRDHQQNMIPGSTAQQMNNGESRNFHQRMEPILSLFRAM